ncbi:MAG: DUF5689 domain-containing protein [Bacteroidales bacterium]
MKKLLLLVFCLTVVTYAMAQPSWFYSGTRQLDEEQLKKVLQEKIDNRAGLSEEAIKELAKRYKQLDKGKDKVLLFYTKTTSRRLNVPTDESESWSVVDYLNQKKETANILNIGELAPPLFSEGGKTVSESTMSSQNQLFKNGFLVEDLAIIPDSAKVGIAKELFYKELQKESPNIYTKSEENLKIADGLTFDNWQVLLDHDSNNPRQVWKLPLNKNTPYFQNLNNSVFGDKAWNADNSNKISFGDIEQNPTIVQNADSDSLAPIFIESGTVNQVTFTYGLSYDAYSYSQNIEDKNKIYPGKLKLTGIEETETKFYRIVANADSSTLDFTLPSDVHVVDNCDIGAIQGAGICSNMIGEHKFVLGRVTGNMDRTWYLQSGEEKRSGIAIEGNVFRGKVGDSVMIGGYVSEKNGVTNISDLNYTFNYHRPIPYRPIEVSIKELKNNPEDYESMLIKIPEVKFINDRSKLPKVGTKIMVNSVKNDEGSINIKIDSSIDLSGKSYPGGVVDIQGILGQEGNEYFIIPRTFSDLNVRKDSIAPKITDLSFDKATAMLRLRYSEPMEPTSVTNPESYTFGNSMTKVEYAKLDETKMIVSLLLSNVPEKEMIFTAKGVKDMSGNKGGDKEYSVNVPTFTNNNYFSTEDEEEKIQLSKSAFKDDELSIKSRDQEIAKIEIYSLVGDKLKEYSIDAFNTTINIRNLRKGMYIADIILDNNDKISRKFVKH